MTDDAKKFLEEVSKNEALKAELFEAFADDHAETAAKFAKAHGYDLTAEDFEGLKISTMSEDELKAVVGGARRRLADGEDGAHFLIIPWISVDSKNAEHVTYCENMAFI